MYLYSLLQENLLNKYTLKLSNITTRVLKGMIVISHLLIITNSVKVFGKAAFIQISQRLDAP